MLPVLVPRIAPTLPISTTVGSADNPTSEMMGLFRIPRFTITDEDDSADTVDRRILDQVALSILLAKHGVPAPRILAFDATSANAIHSPYTFQELATGTMLDEVYDKMSLHEKLSVVDEPCHLASQTRDNHISRRRQDRPPGAINGARVEPSNKTWISGRDIFSPVGGEIEIRSFGVGAGEVKVPTRPTRFLLDMFNQRSQIHSRQ